MVSLSPGAGPTALRMLVTHLLATTDAQRLEAGVDLDNVPAQRTLRHAGFEFEGVLRGVDRMVFGLLRADVAPAGRRVLALSGGVALAESLPGERQRFYAGGTETGELLGGLTTCSPAPGRRTPWPRPLRQTSY